MATMVTDLEAAAVADTIRRYVEAVEAKDMAAYARIVAHDPDLAWYGSMPGQLVGWGAVEAVMQGMFDSEADMRIDQSDLRIRFSPDRRLAWATCLWDWHETSRGGETASVPVRCTWVLERRDADWVIVHWHKSVGVA